MSYKQYGIGLPGMFTPTPRVTTFGLDPLASPFLHGRDNEGMPMFGTTLTVLALLGLVASWRRRSAWQLAALWIGCAALALGTSLWIGKTQYLPLSSVWNGVRVSNLMPYTWFVRLPGLSSFREADRLAILGLLPAALLAGAAVEWCRYHAKPLLAVVAVGVILESGYAGYSGDVRKVSTIPVSYPGVDRGILNDHSNSIVLDLPFGLRGGIPVDGVPFFPQALVMATEDGHPRSIAYTSRVPKPTINAINNHPFYKALIDAEHEVAGEVPVAAGHRRIRWAPASTLPALRCPARGRGEQGVGVPHPEGAGRRPGGRRPDEHPLGRGVEAQRQRQQVPPHVPAQHRVQLRLPDPVHGKDPCWSTSGHRGVKGRIALLPFPCQHEPRAYPALAAASSNTAAPAMTTGHTLNQTTGVRAPVSAVSTPSATSSAAATRYTQARTSVTAPPAAVAAITIAATPHMVNASASHSCTMTRRLSTLTGPNPATTWRVGTICATPTLRPQPRQHKPEPCSYPRRSPSPRGGRQGPWSPTRRCVRRSRQRPTRRRG